MDLERMNHIWKWLLDPDISQPENLKAEELVGVYGRNITLLLNLRHALSQMSGMYSSLNLQKAKDR